MRSGHTDDELLTADEVRELMQVMGRTNMGLRNAAMVAVFWRAGLRCQEAIDLRVGDVDHTERRLHVRMGKGGRARSLRVDDGLLAHIEVWSGRRSLLPAVSGDVLFCSRSGTKLATTYVRRVFRTAAQRAGIDRADVRVHPHALRHLFTSELYREGMPPADIAKLLGHTTVQTTWRYLKRVSTPEAERHIDERPDWSTQS